MYERFTREARQVVVQAQEEVRSLGHDQARPEHLLLALTHVDTWVRDLLVGRGITHERVRGELMAGPGIAGSVALGHEWRRVLEVASREADRLGRTTVGAEHLLLGVLEQGGEALGCLHELGQQPDELRKAVLSVGPGHDPEEAGPLSGAEVEAFLSEVEEAAASGGARIWSASTFPELTRLVPLPRCPACETSLPGNLSHHRLTAGPELTVDVVACGVCGHTLSVTPYRS